MSSLVQNSNFMIVKQCIFHLFYLFLLLPSCHAQTVIKINKAGTLNQILSQEQQDTCRSLIIEGKINSEDIKTLRRMAGYKEEGFKTGQLEILNLRKCEFKTDKNPFMVLDAKKERLAGTALPSKIRWWTSEYAKGPIDKNFNSLTTFSGGNAQYRILKYSPFFFLNYDKTDAVKITRYVPSNMDKGWGPTKSWESVGDFRFTKENNEDEWQEMKCYKIDNFIGHKIIEDDGRILIQASLKKGKFTHDTFYKCPHLRYVFLPENIVCVPYIFDYNSNIKYYVGSKPYPWAFDMRLKPMDWERTPPREIAEKYWYGY